MKRIGIKDIARLAHVSRGTVDRALHGRPEIREEVRKRILKVIRESGYKPNLAARALVVGKASITIGVCIPHEIRFFFDQVRDGIMDEGRRYESVGVSLDYRPIQRLGMDERKHIREMLKSNINALILAPGDPRGVAPLIDDAEKKGIHVVCVATDAPETLRSSAVCGHPELNGRCAGELMGKFLSPASRVAIVTGDLRIANHQREVSGFCEAFAQFSERGKVIEVLEDHEDETEAFKKSCALLKSSPRIKSIYVSTANCLPVCAALRTLGLTAKVKLITTDLFPELAPWFEQGTILASIYQRPYVQGQTAVRLVVDHIITGVPFPRAHYLPPLTVLRSNLHTFREVSSQAVGNKSVRNYL